MSISSDVSIKREKALERVYNLLISQQESLVRQAVNSMSNDDLANFLHDEMYFYHVEGKKGKILAPWEKE